jgi:hypothetical protein
VPSFNRAEPKLASYRASSHGPQLARVQTRGEDPRPGNTERFFSVASTCCLPAPSDDVVQPHPERIDSRGVELRVEWRPAFLG